MPAETKEIIVLLVELLRGDLQTPDGKPFGEDQVRVYNQTAKIPEDDRDYVVVAYRRAQPYGRIKEYVPLPPIPPATEGTLVEAIDQMVQETYTISIFSAGPRARHNKEQVLFALNCERSERMQEIHGFKIGNLPTEFVDASAAEASLLLNRYDISFNVLARYHRERSVLYFDKFKLPSLTTNQ